MVLLAGLAVTLSACQFVVTPDGTAYTYAFTNGTVTVTAATTSGDNEREFFWASKGATEANTSACATFSGGQDDDQPGIAMRIADNGAQAVTVTENIFGVNRAVFNFHTWNTAESPVFTQFGSTTISALPSYPATWPLSMCAEIVGPIVQFVVWTNDMTQPAWGDSTWGGQATLPPDVPALGQSGFYVGHLKPGTTLTYSGLTVDGVTNDPIS